MSYSLNDELRMVWNSGNFLQEDTKPRIVNIHSGESICVLVGHTDYIRGALMLDADTVVTWSNDKTLRIWRLDGECIATLSGHDEYINSVLISGIDQIISSSGDGTVRLWSWRDGICHRTFLLEGVEPHNTPSLACNYEDRLVIQLDYRVVLVDLKTGETVFEAKTDSYFPKAFRFDNKYFMINHDKKVHLHRWDDGELETSLPANGFYSLFLPFPDGRLLIVSSEIFKRKTVTFQLWRVHSADLLDEIILGGEAALSIAHHVQPDQVIVQLKDYRHLVLSLKPLCVVEKSDLQGVRSAGFDNFSPEQSFKNYNGDKRLKVVVLDQRSAKTVNYSQIEGRPDIWKSGALEDGRIIHRTVNQWRVYDTEMAEYETLSNAAMEEVHPKFMEALRWRKCLNGEAESLIENAAETLGTETNEIRRAAKVLQTESNTPATLTLGIAGHIIAHELENKTIWRLNDSGDKFELISRDDPTCFLNNELVAESNGRLMRWTNSGLASLSSSYGNSLAIHPHVCSKFNNYQLRSNNHLLIRDGEGVSVYNAADGQQISFLDGGHGMGNWGLRLIPNGPVVTWNRMSLRSWDPASYAPLVELQDPEDWGPGYEGVEVAGNKIIFYVGQYSSDSRIMIWDGAYGLTVYSAHTAEIGTVRMIKPDLFMSETAEAGRATQFHQWQVPPN